MNYEPYFDVFRDTIPFKVEMNTELFELMQSIEKEGVLVPLLARPNPAGQGYELIAGHRRKAASKWAGVSLFE